MVYPTQIKVAITEALPIFTHVRWNFYHGSAKTEPGRDPDEDEHPRTIHSFRIANVEVTQQLYSLVTRHNPSPDKHPSRPIASITWWEAVRFCNQLSSLEYDPVYRDLDTTAPRQIRVEMAFDCPQKPSGSGWQSSTRQRFHHIRNKQIGPQYPPIHKAHNCSGFLAMSGRCVGMYTLLTPVIQPRWCRILPLWHGSPEVDHGSTEPIYSVLQTEPLLTLTAVQTPSDLDWFDPLFLALVLRIGYS